MKNSINYFGIIIFGLALLTSCGENSSLPDNFCGKYYERDLSGNPTSDYVEMNKDGSCDGEKNAYGKYSASHLGEWANGPDSWTVSFSKQGGKLSSYFDDSQVIYYHEVNNATGERNYYRLNGLMPETDAATDFYKN
jgi:hypothetical protein